MQQYKNEKKNHLWDFSKELLGRFRLKRKATCVRRRCKKRQPIHSNFPLFPFIEKQYKKCLTDYLDNTLTPRRFRLLLVHMTCQGHHLSQI